MPRALFLTRVERSDYQTIRKAGTFNSRYYRSQRPRNITAQLVPLRHYLVWGEKKGLWPEYDFSPAAYVANNPTLLPRNSNLYAHYLTVGRRQGLRATPVPIDPQGLPADLQTLPLLNCLRTEKSTNRLAIVVHIYFYELWDEIAAALRNLPEPFALYCTVTKRPGFDELAARIRGAFPEATVLAFPNHGRDIFPFVHVVNSGLLSTYEAVCKVHTKMSQHLDDGDEWRRELLSALLPSGPTTDRLVSRFLEDPSMGMIAADDYIFSHTHFWGPNRQRADELMNRLGLSVGRKQLCFAGGSFYWVKQPALRLLQSLQLQAEDFERESGQVDGTTAHAVERLMGFLVQASGQKLVGSRQLLAENAAITRV